MTDERTPLGHPHPPKWTFTTDAGSGPQTSAQRFHTPEDAADAAGAWLCVCAENRFYPSVAIGTVGG